MRARPVGRKEHMKSRNQNIDAVRAIACIFVVLVHCVLPGAFGQYVISYARFAVPFFLLVSGWFAYSPDRKVAVRKAARKLKDTALLTLSGTLLYIGWNSYNQYHPRRKLLHWLISYFSNQESWFNLLVYNRAVFLCSVMYYLFMMLYVYLIVIVLGKLGLLRKSRWFIPVGLVWNYALGAVFNAPWYHSGNFLLTALPFFLLGGLLRERFEEKPLPRKYLLGALGLGLVLTFVESTLLGDVYCYVGSMVTAVAALLLCVSGTFSMPGWLAGFGRKYSTYIFILHCGVRDTLNAMTKNTFGSRHPWLMPFVAIAISVAIGFIIELVKAGIQRLRKDA